VNCPGQDSEIEMPDCLIVSAIADELAEQVVAYADFPIAINACNSAEEALAKYAGESIVFGRPDMIAQILPELPNVEWVQSSWAGVTPLMAIDRRDYVLTAIKGVFGPQMSEYVFGFLLAHELKVLQRMEQQREHNWFNECSGMLHGKRIGMMGTGTIAQHVVETASCFGMTATGLSRSGKPAPGFKQVMRTGEINNFLEEVDYLVAALPSTADTDNLLNAASLAKLPAHAYFVNVGRGNVVDEDALIDALKNGRMAGAALDVFHEEPISQDSPLWDTPNLSITGHIAAASYPAIIVPVFVDNYRRYRNGQSLECVVDFDVGY
jgi:phosphoglycerate dehydrogenase-like enzyme